jgi:uncharacterized protein YjiS (DUF1127 family)
MRTIRGEAFGASVAAERHLAGSPNTLFGTASLMLHSFGEMLEKRRSRRLLMELTDEQLKDIGLSRADAFREARRLYWFW